MKELWVKAHERLIDAYLESKPEASWTEAYEKTAPMVDELMSDLLANQIDEARMRKKYE